MSDSPAGTETSPDPAPRPRSWRTLLERVLTTALWLGLATGSFYTVTALRELLTPAPAPPGLATTTAAAHDAAIPLTSIAGGGFWGVKDSRWRLRTEEVSAQVMQERFTRLTDPQPVAEPAIALRPTAADNSSSDNSSSDKSSSHVAADDTAELLALVQSLAASVDLPGNRKAYTASGPAGRFRLVTWRQGERETIVAGLAALPADAPDRWLVLEMISQVDRPTDRAGALLPLPVGAEEICCRVDDRGRPSLQILAAPDSPANLVKHWRRAGWRVESVAAAGPPRYLCVRESYSVLATILKQTDADCQVLLVQAPPLSNSP
ncbi:hypothetical protein [Lignipirellula cremea]|uniref:Uncharacterized protein n=1 Tax=Lignipirellula cremea TaxID=2528010 RepID=A0A518E0R9_9BACT|nr:hypothetical protein [Lignipirellula cremea]QDU97688.1 hypothetical protein Pla8534_55410 [Lignipirellula cremea]